jgi:acetyl esterase/lipase
MVDRFVVPTITCAAWLICNSFASAQSSNEVIPLWEAGAPGFEEKKDEPEKAESYWVKNIHNPSITAFLPDKDKATGAAVVICPGGGHKELVFKAEGVEAAQYFNSIGVAAFALKYRLAREEGSPYDINVHAREDGQQAIRLVRSRAKEWGIDPTRVGMLGFSAGGEVVSMVSYADGQGKADAEDEIERENARPDFQMLVYPGGLGIPEEVPRNAPPAFLLVANDDVGASRSIVDLLPKFRRAGVPVEVHIYARGGHAFNMGNRSKLTTLKTWPQRMTDWMNDNFILNPEGREEYLKSVEEQRERMQRFRQRSE